MRYSHQRSEEKPKCVACWCENCKKRRDKIDNVAVNLVYDDMIVNLCDNYLVENTQGGEKVMILDPEAPMSVAGRHWLEKYLADFDYKIEDMVSSKCYQVFRFGGINKRHVSTLLIELPLLIKSMNGREYVLKEQV